MEIQINGEGFDGLPTDHKVKFEDAHLGSTTSGFTISNDDAFSSNVDRGRLVYTVPSFNESFRKQRKNFDDDKKQL